MKMLINNLPYSANVALANIGRVVKIKYIRSFRPDEEHEVIGSIVKVDEDFHYITIGHPYDLNKKMTIAGAIGLDYNDDKIDITFIDKSYFNIWFINYYKFHCDILNSKGYDSIFEDYKKLRY